MLFVPAPFWRISGGGNDSFTKLLLHTDGVNNSTTFTDSSAAAHTMTRGGSAHIDTGQSKFGGASARFSGSDWVQSADHADWELGSANFTIDLWFRMNTLPSVLGSPSTLLAHLTDVDNLYRLFINTDNSINFQVVDAAAQTVGLSTGGTALSAATWYHVAIVRNGSNWILFRDGISRTTATFAGAVTDYTDVLTLGTEDGSGLTWPLDGWLDEVRISKGVARWTSNFTLRTLAYA